MYTFNYIYMYILKSIYKFIYFFYLCSLREPRSNDTPLAMNIAGSQILISKCHAPKVIGLLSDIADSMVQTGKVQNELEINFCFRK